MPVPQTGDLVLTGGTLHLITGRASGADIAYGHPITRATRADPTALVEIRDVPTSEILPRTTRTIALAERLSDGVTPSRLAALHDAADAAATTAIARRRINTTTRAAAPPAASGTGNS